MFIQYALSWDIELPLPTSASFLVATNRLMDLTIASQALI